MNADRLETLRSNIADALLQFVFEPNDETTWEGVRTALSEVIAAHNVYDFLVVCDATTNTPAVVANNELRADVAIRETEGTVEYVYLPVRIGAAVL